MRVNHKLLFFFLAWLLLVVLPKKAHCAAAPDEQTGASPELSNPFSDYVPFQDEYDVDEDERFMYFGRYFGVELGTGMHEFTGNIGKLYNTALPVLYFDLLYFFDFRLAGQIGISSADHAFDAAPNGLVQVNLLSINADLKYYFNTKDSGAAITSASPYIIAGIAQTFRTQTFQTQNNVIKDTAGAFSGGLGVEFVLKPRSTSLGVEGRVHDIIFKDRYAPTYAPSGIPDTTGLMYSFVTNIIFFF